MHLLLLLPTRLKEECWDVIRNEKCNCSLTNANFFILVVGVAGWAKRIVNGFQMVAVAIAIDVTGIGAERFAVV